MQSLPTGLSSRSVDTNISSFFPDLRLPMAVSRCSTGLAFRVMALCKIEAAFLVLPYGAQGRKMEKYNLQFSINSAVSQHSTRFWMGYYTVHLHAFCKHMLLYTLENKDVI